MVIKIDCYHCEAAGKVTVSCEPEECAWCFGKGWVEIIEDPTVLRKNERCH